MPSPIPVSNLYYLLAYAWDEFVSGEETDLTEVAFDNIHDLLAWVLSRGIRKLGSVGMDKSYTGMVQQTSRLKGRVHLADSYQRMTYRSGEMICAFDELTADTVPNQLLRATCDRLLKSDAVVKKVRSEIRHAQRLLHDITSIRLTSQLFHRVQLHRNNRHYRMLLHVCRMLHELWLPEEAAGGHRFREILTDETRMPQLFEKFVRNFAKRHLRDTYVYSERISWDGIGADEDVSEVVPTMLTDVTLETSTRKTILDCKFYRDAFVTRHGSRRLHSMHLYQLNAYLQNKSRHEGWEDVDGILLYPAVAHACNYQFRLLGHAVRICSVDLDRPWQEIEARLIEILSATGTH
ncbi:MAG: 5-methylcytosine restriction system specificity protein McrC [Planctomyces sp.]|jgi:5-methylcytosine-specific restriction enzyme subunit McrC